MLNDIRFTLLQTVNEIQRTLGLNETALTANKIATELVDHVNAVVSDISDSGNWMECLATAKVTAQSSVATYSVATSAVIKNIGDVYISTRRGPLRSVDIDTMRIMTRVTARGQPSQYCIYGTDSIGNPLLKVRPIPSTAENGSMFSILFYVKPPIYTTSDGSQYIPFPKSVVIPGVLARYTLRESGGAPTKQFEMYYQEYKEAREKAYKRFNGSTGWDISFRPSRTGRRK